MPFKKGNQYGKSLAQSKDSAVIKLLLSSEETDNGCILAKKYLSDRGYPRMRVETKKKYMSHIFYERYIGEIPAGMCMLHKCDTPACINPRHLFIGTKADNTYDMVGKGRNYIQPLGEKHPRASISNAIAKKIKIEYVPRKVPASYLAKKYGTTRAVVYDIIKGRSWKEAV